MSDPKDQYRKKPNIGLNFGGIFDAILGVGLDFAAGAHLVQTMKQYEPDHEETKKVIEKYGAALPAIKELQEEIVCA